MQSQYSGKSTMDLVLAGVRTRTTRVKTEINRMLKDYQLTRIEDLVGKVVKMTDLDGRVAYTRITAVTKFSKQYQEDTWHKEGWVKTVTDKFINDKNAYGIEFELVTQAPNSSTVPVAIPETLAPNAVVITKGRMEYKYPTTIDVGDASEVPVGPILAFSKLSNKDFITVEEAKDLFEEENGLGYFAALADNIPREVVTWARQSEENMEALDAIVHAWEDRMGEEIDEDTGLQNFWDPISLAKSLLKENEYVSDVAQMDLFQGITPEQQRILDELSGDGTISIECTIK